MSTAYYIAWICCIFYTIPDRLCSSSTGSGVHVGRHYFGLSAKLLNGINFLFNIKARASSTMYFKSFFLNSCQCKYNNIIIN